MTAGKAEAGAAQQALELGEQLSREYWQAAGSNPGVGWQVSLPSAPSPIGPVQGEGFNLPADSPALSAPAPRRLVPTYGSPQTGGAGYHSAQLGTANGLDGVDVSWARGVGEEDFRQRWPKGSSRSISYVSPSRGRRPASEQTSAPKSEPAVPISKSGRIRKALRQLRRK